MFLFSIIGGLLIFSLELYGLAVIAHFVLSLIKPSTSNKWIELLNLIVEPALQPLRKLLTSMFNARFDKFDWSHIVLLVLLQIVSGIVSWIF
ncbi:MAG: YggT family protein [Clostridiales bacterium]|nr:YggT family protein [Clostridiales bacterium]